MSSRASKFLSRAPRYTLNPSDNRFLRYAKQNEQGHTYTTRFIDISQTGLAFITDRENAPGLSDLLKIEIPLSDTETVAWWARVVRIEEYAPHKWYMKANDFQDQNQVMVAVTFHELPPGHTRLIRETLDKKFAEVRAIENQQRMKHMTLYIASRFWRFLFYAGSIAATIWFLYWLSLPSYNYDASKGAPWGQRYPWLNIFTPSEKPKID
jgi:PilZ domain